MARCETCNGAGAITTRSTCTLCQGTAERVGYDDDGNETLKLCPNCEDGLMFIEEACPACGGKGEVWPFQNDPFKHLR